MAAVVPAVVLRLSGWRTEPVIDTAVFGTAMLAAGLMLSWDAEAAEKRISQGPILTLVTVLPEYAVGKVPESNYGHYAAVNMTGANRLLFGVAWPLMAILHWLCTRQRGIAMATVNVIEICSQPRGCRQGSGLGLSIMHRVVEHLGSYGRRSGGRFLP